MCCKVFWKNLLQSISKKFVAKYFQKIGSYSLMWRKKKTARPARAPGGGFPMVGNS
jgi:hypothetical protein